MPYIGNQPSDLVVPTPTVDTFTGNGSQDNYTLVRAVNNAALLEVFVDNVQQQPTVAYSVSGTTLTFTEPPANGTSIYIIYRDNPTYPLLSVLNNTVNTAAIVDNAVTSAKIASVANTKISGNIISSQITSVANTQITGNIISSQIASVANTKISGNIISSQITSVANTQVTGIMLPANGGTGLTSPGANGNVLTSDGTSWVSSTPAASGLTQPQSYFYSSFN